MLAKLLCYSKFCVWQGKENGARIEPRGMLAEKNSVAMASITTLMLEETPEHRAARILQVLSLSHSYTH
jgi:hypothetical protein